MNQYDYTYGVAYIRAIENKLLTTQDMENLITAKTYHDAVRVLADKYSFDTSGELCYEEILTTETQKAWSDVRYALPRGASLDFLIYKNDFHNLKVALKGVMTGVESYDKFILSPSTVSFELILTAIEKKEFSLLPPMLASVAAEAYDILSRTRDSQLADTIIDKSSMRYSMKASMESGNDFLIGYVRLLNTLCDIKIAVRCTRTLKMADYMHKAFSDCSYLPADRLINACLSGEEVLTAYLEESGHGNLAKAAGESMQLFEKLSDNEIGEYMKKSSNVSFGVEPLVSYINRKEMEIQNVRIIMSAKLNGFSEEDIRKRIRSL